MNRTFKLATIIALSISACAATAQDSGLKWTEDPGTAFEIFPPQQINLVKGLPPGIVMAKSLSDPYYGTLTLGPKGHESRYLIQIDAVADKTGAMTKAFYYSAHPNGKPTEVASAQPIYLDDFESNNKQKVKVGSYTKISVDEPGSDGLRRATVLLYPRLWPKENGKSLFVGYALDSCWSGNIELGKKKYLAQVRDRYSLGDYSQPSKPDDTPDTCKYVLTIDVNGDGKFGQGEEFDAHKPFNIGGTTYELSGWSVDGSHLQVVKSAQTVAETLPLQKEIPHDTGDLIPPFVAKTTDGRTVNFPADYKGKVVLLDFWATWCGICLATVPDAEKMYAKYHDKGFDVLGFSVDNPGIADKVVDVAKRHGMTWPQIYDGKAGQSPFVLQFGLCNSSRQDGDHEIAVPMTFLVDGDTSKILGWCCDTWGLHVIPAVEKAMDDKFKLNDQVESWLSLDQTRERPLQADQSLGSFTSLADMKSKVVLLQFFNPGSDSNMQNLTDLAPFYKKYHSKGLEIVGVTPSAQAQSGGPKGDDLTRLQAIAAVKDMTWPIIVGPNHNFEEYRVANQPVTFIVFSGMVFGGWIGNSPETLQKIEKDIKLALPSGA